MIRTFLTSLSFTLALAGAADPALARTPGVTISIVTATSPIIGLSPPINMETCRPNVGATATECLSREELCRRRAAAVAIAIDSSDRCRPLWAGVIVAPR